MPRSSDARDRKRRRSRHVVVGWLGVLVGCAVLWAGEAILHHAIIVEQLKHKPRTYSRFAFSSLDDDPLAFAKAQMQTARHIALLLGGGAWFVAGVTIFFARPWRRQIAQVCLAGVIVAAVAWSVNPTLAWRRASVVAPLPIGIALAGLVSLLALLIPVRRAELKASDCTGCGYDLTGNRSGICPECGRPTMRKLADRWHGQAEQLRTLSDSNDNQINEVQLPEWPGRFSDPEPCPAAPKQ